MSRVILLALSDTHANHKLGLLSPDTVLHDEDEDGELYGYKPSLTATQKFLWRLFLECLNSVVELADGDDIIVIHNGDLTHGMRHKDHLVSTRSADEVLISLANLEPVMKMPGVKAIRLTYGTESHVGLSGGSEQMAVKWLRAEYPEISSKGFYHGRLTINGAVVDVSHHGPNQSSRIWLDGNIARYYLRDFMLEDLRHGIEPPDLVLRSHFHVKIDEVITLDWNGKTYETRIIVTPAMCMMNDYARKVTKSRAFLTNGMVAFEIVDGHVHSPCWLVETNDMRTKESL